MKRSSRRMHRVYHRTRIRLSGTRARLRAWHVGILGLIVLLLLFVQGMSYTAGKKVRCYQQAVEQSKQTIITSLENDTSPKSLSQFDASYSKCMSRLL